MAPVAKNAEAAKAQNAKKAALKGVNGVAKRKIVTSATFRRPRTLRQKRQPKYERKSVARVAALDNYSIIRQPVVSEVAMKKIETENTLTFLVDIRSNKIQIRQAIKKLYEADVQSVNTLITPIGEKKAFVRLSKDVEAIDVANKAGLL
ncbi:hypothetical protein GQ42DRAFT_160718 [Ramicandelaber brevisporus]|nr:hypothetical protein GQ42DRAFT_160718 [Ramicandelaber brevisporus]